MLSRRLIAIIFAFGLIFPSLAKAEAVPAARILITEIQTESENSALDDFIELTNRSESDVDVTGWEIQTKATGATSDWIKRVVLDGVIHPDGSILLSYADATHDFLGDEDSGNFSSGLSTTGGHVRLFDTNQVIEEDKVGWGTAQDPETSPAPKPLKPNSISRKSIDGLFIDTNNNGLDFELNAPSPRADNAAPINEDEETEEVPDEEPAEDPGETENTEEDPEGEVPDTPPDSTPADSEPEVPEGGSSEQPDLPDLALRINEILPDPITPQTDANDEWIEIYNPNSEDVNLKDYKLQTGLKFTYSFTFSDIMIAANGYLYLTSQETNLVLSNSEGAVRLLDPFGQVMDILSNYKDVETGEAYAYDGFGWQWTTTPTQGTENIITQPIIEPKPIKAAVKSVKKATTVKAASTSKKTAAATKAKKAEKLTPTREVFEDPASIATEPPLHPRVLAGAGALAILYGGYEYREDFRNKLFRFKRYFKFWRAVR